MMTPVALMTGRSDDWNIRRRRGSSAASIASIASAAVAGSSPAPTPAPPGAAAGVGLVRSACTTAAWPYRSSRACTRSRCRNCSMDGMMRKSGMA